MEIIKNKTENINIDENQVILDIETTGLSSKYAAIYMIGLIYNDNKKTKFEQWFALKKEDEYEILFKLFQLIKDKIIITFNGDSFDMPFIKNRAKLYSLDCPSYISIDLIKPMKKIKSILGLENVKLKTVEHYFGHFRDDTFTGGMLIEVYLAYLESFDEKLKQVLLLHNYDDLIGLYKIYLQKGFILSLSNMIKGKYEPKITSFQIKGNEFKIEIYTDFISDIKIERDLICIVFSNNTCTITGKAFKGTLKHFFKDYTNYYYLPEEDLAVHKSVGKFIMDKQKEKAKKENCSIKEDGIFLPTSKNTSLLLFKESYSSDKYFVSLNNIKELNQVNEYVKILLTLL